MFYLTRSTTSTNIVIQTFLLTVVLDFKPSYVSLMVQKRSCSLSTKFNQNFYKMIKIRLIIINNMSIFNIHDESLL